MHKQWEEILPRVTYLFHVYHYSYAKKKSKNKVQLQTSMYIFLILPENWDTEFSSVKIRLKEKQHFNLSLEWTSTVSEFLRFFAIIDTMHSVDSMKILLSWIMILCKAGHLKIHPKEKHQKEIWTNNAQDHNIKLLSNEYGVKFKASILCKIDWNFLRDCFSLHGHKHLHNC